MAQQLWSKKIGQGCHALLALLLMMRAHLEPPQTDSRCGKRNWTLRGPCDLDLETNFCGWHKMSCHTAVLLYQCTAQLFSMWQTQTCKVSVQTQSKPCQSRALSWPWCRWVGVLDPWPAPQLKLWALNSNMPFNTSWIQQITNTRSTKSEQTLYMYNNYITCVAYNLYIFVYIVYRLNRVEKCLQTPYTYNRNGTKDKDVRSYCLFGKCLSSQIWMVQPRALIVGPRHIWCKHQPEHRPLHKTSNSYQSQSCPAGIFGIHQVTYNYIFFLYKILQTQSKLSRALRSQPFDMMLSTFLETVSMGTASPENQETGKGAATPLENIRLWHGDATCTLNVFKAWLCTCTLCVYMHMS